MVNLVNLWFLENYFDLEISHDRIGLVFRNSIIDVGVLIIETQIVHADRIEIFSIVSLRRLLFKF